MKFTVGEWVKVRKFESVDLPIGKPEFKRRKVKKISGEWIMLSDGSWYHKRAVRKMKPK